MNTTFVDKISNLLPGRILQNEPMSKHTTMGVGGQAKYFVTVNTTEEMLLAIKLAKEYKEPFFILGKGSNIIVSDKGILGLVIQSNIQTFEVLENYQTNIVSSLVTPRHENLDKSIEIDKYGKSWDEKTPVQYIKVGSGWKLMVLIQKCIDNGLTGLEWFYGIAGSVGGAVYMNVHGAKFYFSNFLVAVEVINENNAIENLDSSQMELDYDYSLFHKRKLTITNIILRLYKGDKAIAQNVISEWGKDKIIKQPQRSSGCMFQNITVEKQKELELPTPSMGYIIDKVLQLAGTKIGGAMISQRHCAFIENTGNATASDVKALVDLIKQETQAKLGFEPKLEVEFVGENIEHRT